MILRVMERLAQKVYGTSIYGNIHIPVIHEPEHASCRKWWADLKISRDLFSPALIRVCTLLWKLGQRGSFTNLSSSLSLRALVMPDLRICPASLGILTSQEAVKQQS